MTQLEALQKKFINLRFGTFIHFNSATFQFHNNPDIIDWEYDHENGDLPRQFPFDEKDFNPTAPEYCKQWAKIAKSAGCQFAALPSPSVTYPCNRASEVRSICKTTKSKSSVLAHFNYS